MGRKFEGASFGGISQLSVSGAMGKLSVNSQMRRWLGIAA